MIVKILKIGLILSVFLVSCDKKDSSNSSDGAGKNSGLGGTGNTTGSLTIQLDDPEVDNATVKAYIVGFEGQVEASADENGLIIFPNVPEGQQETVIMAETLAVTALNSSSRAVRLENLRIIPGTNANRDKIKVPISGSLSGIVKKAGMEDNLGILVFIPGTHYQALTDETGSFAIPAVPVGNHSIAFLADGYYPLVIPPVAVVSEVDTAIEEVELLVSTGAEGLLQIETGADVITSRTAKVFAIAEGDPALMKFSETPDFLGVSWIPYASFTSHTFSKPGLNTLYVKFANANGLESSPYSATVTVVLGEAALVNALNGATSDQKLSTTVEAANATRYRYMLTDELSSCNVENMSEWFEINAPLDVSLGVDGKKKICLQGADEYGPIQLQPSIYSWIKDTVAPVPTVEVEPKASYSSEQLSMSANRDGDSAMVRSSFQAGETCSSLWSVWLDVSDLIVISHMAQGVHTLCLESKDLAGNISLVPTIYVWQHDTTSPVLSVKGLPQASSQISIVSLSIEADESIEYQFSILGSSSDCSSASYSTWKSSSIPVVQDIGVDGQKTLCINARDGAGNTLSAPFSYSWEKNTQGVAATANVPSSGYTNLSNLDVTVAGNRVSDYRYAFSSGFQSCISMSFGGWLSTSSQINLSLPSDQTYTLCLLGRDHLGSEQFIPKQYYLTRDTFSNTPNFSGAPITVSNQTNISVWITNVSEYQHKLLFNSADCSAGTYSVYTSTAINIAVVTNNDGNYRLCIKGRDSAGNEATNERSWARDTIAPDISISNLPNSVDNLSNLNISVSSTDASYWQGVVQDQTFACDVAAWGGINNIATSLTLSTGASGNKRVCIRTSDLAGNYSATAEHSWSNEIDDPVTTPNISSFYASDTTAGPTTDFNGIATDIGGQGVASVELSIQMGVGASTCLNNAMSAFDGLCPNYLQAAGTDVWALTASDSLFVDLTQYNLMIRSTDSAGNIEVPLTRKFTWDETPPSAPSDLHVLPVDSSVKLFWQPSAEAEGFLLVFNQTQSVSSSLVNGTIYSINENLAAGDKVIYAGSNLGYNQSGLTNGVLGYYSLFSYDSLYRYSSVGFVFNATPQIPVFGGIQDARIVGPNYLYRLSWADWNDLADDPSTIDYDVFTANLSAAQNFGSPNKTVVDGTISTMFKATSWNDPFFVVRGDALSGASDNNTTELQVSNAIAGSKFPITNVAPYYDEPDENPNVWGTSIVDRSGNVITKINYYEIVVLCHENTVAPYCLGRLIGKMYPVIGNGSAGTASEAQHPITGIFSNNSPENYSLHVDRFYNIYSNTNRYLFALCNDVSSDSPCKGKTIGRIGVFVGNNSYGDPADNSNPLATPIKAIGSAFVSKDGNLLYTSGLGGSSSYKAYVVCYFSTGYFCNGETVGNNYLYAGGGNAATKTVTIISGASSGAKIFLDVKGNVYIGGYVLGGVNVICEDTTFGICKGKLSRRVYDVSDGVVGAWGATTYGSHYSFAVEPSGNIYTISGIDSSNNGHRYLAAFCFESRTTGYCQNKATNAQYLIAGGGSSEISTASTLTGFKISRPYQLSLDFSGNPIWADTWQSLVVTVCLQTANIQGFCKGKVDNQAYPVLYETSTSPPTTNIPATDTAGGFSGSAVDSLGNVYAGSGVICYDVSSAGPCQGKTVGNWYTLVGSADGASNSSVWEVEGVTSIAVDNADNVYYADSLSFKVRVICHHTGQGGICNSKTSGNIYTLVGTSLSGDSADGTLGVNASVGSVKGLEVTSNGNVIFTDAQNYKLRILCFNTGATLCSGKIQDGVYTLAGLGSSVESTDNVLATSSSLAGPDAVTLDSANNIYLSESSTRVSVICQDSVTGACSGKTIGNIHHVAGTGTEAVGGSGPALSTNIGAITDLTIDAQNNVIALDETSKGIRVICSTVAAGYCNGKVAGNSYFAVSFTAVSGGIDYIPSSNDFIITGVSELGLQRIYMVRGWN